MKALAIIIVLAVYLIPTWVAWSRHYQVISVALVNWFFGWTIIGWIIALIMAVRDKPQPVALR